MTYFVTSSTGDTIWHETNAKTLRGAKSIASQMYNQSVNGRIEVGIDVDQEFGRPVIEVVAVKYGYDKHWSNAV